MTGAGRADLDVISLFPENTYKKRRNGLRADLVQTLADMKPGFLRFPGGCIVEGKDLANAYRWKDTIGDIAARPQNWNRWMDWKAPEYHQTYGLGFYEYFLLCEDIGAEPVPVINVGMACQFQTGQTVPLSELDPWVQDALDLVEFANGPVTSVWGAKRAAMGHPKPFNMKFLGVGNEQWGEGYFERYKIFYDAIKAKYPDIRIASTSRPGVDDQWWNLAWSKFKTGTPAQVVDEHYYRPPAWFHEHHDRYDSQDRKGPKVFVGEFAAHTSGRRNNLEAALAEAAFMTGLVRNADVVQMTSYAPLFARAGATQWTPDLIWFDNTRVYGSPSYYVQKLFATNRPDQSFPVAIESAVPRKETRSGRAGVGTWATQAEYKDIKVTRGGQTLFAGNFAGIPTKGTTGKWEIIDGVLRQTSDENGARLLFGDTSWSDYTLSLKARKLSGPEGFLVLFQLPDDDAVVWWNIGGWGNTRHGLELPGTAVPSVPGQIETNRWYDIRVELQGSTVKCYLEGKLIHTVTQPTPPRLFAVAGRDTAGGDILLKVVNTSADEAEMTVYLRGASGSAKAAPVLKGSRTLLTGADISDENSFDNPRKVAPRETAFGPVSTVFAHKFPARSLTILRLKPQP
jgi:alpha-L-arabinofuranosidase